MVQCFTVEEPAMTLLMTDMRSDRRGSSTYLANQLFGDVRCQNARETN